MGFFSRKPPPPRDALDDMLFTWSDGTRFAVRDMLRSVEVKGITGSGKSSGSLMFFLRALIAHPGTTLLIIAQKPEEREIVEAEFARAGKKDKLIVVDKSAMRRTNGVDVERAAGADARGIVEYLTTLGEALDGGQASGRSNEQFWRKSEERMTYNAVEAVRLGTGEVSAPDLLDFISSAPYSPQAFDSKNHPESYSAFQNGFHYQTMKTASDRRKDDVEAHDWRVVNAYWGKEFPFMDDKPRSSILAGVMNTLHTANTGLARRICSTDTTVAPKVFDEGYSVLVDFPFSEFGPTGRYVAGSWKFLTQKHILRRKWKPPMPFNVLVLDEFQESVTEMDARYLAQCRSHGGAMLCLTQTVHSEFGALSGAHGGHHKADCLLSQFGHHIFHTVDSKTAEFASNLLGKRREVFINTSVSPDKQELWDMIASGQAHMSFSASENYQPVLQPRVFMSGLRSGGPANDYCVDGIIIKLGEAFNSGENWLFVSFPQR